MFRLALALGKTVAEIETTMPARELTEWGRYYAAEPFGQFRDNLHAGIVAAAILNSNRQRNSPVVSPSDFLLVSREQSRRRELAKSVARLRALAKPKKVGT